MKPELEEKLFKKYPKIFKQKDMPMEQTAMCWGLQCGDGWYDIIDKTCEILQWYTDRNGHPQVEFNTVKEKYGELVMDTDRKDDFQNGIITMAQYLSSFICELCGKPGKLIDRKGWLSTLCEKCKLQK